MIVMEMIDMYQILFILDQLAFYLDFATTSSEL